MSDDEARLEAFEEDSRLTRALETIPSVEIPDDFAARVMSKVPLRRAAVRVPASLPSTHYGRNVMLVCTILLCTLLVGLAAAAPHGSAVVLVAQWVVFAQLGAIALGFVLRPGRR